MFKIKLIIASKLDRQGGTPCQVQCLVAKTHMKLDSVPPLV
jgi:hypothetical protein